MENKQSNVKIEQEVIELIASEIRLCKIQLAAEQANQFLGTIFLHAPHCQLLFFWYRQSTESKLVPKKR